MQAIINDRNQQYQVQEGDELVIDLLKAREGSIVFDKVLLINENDDVMVGEPYVPNATVEASILGTASGNKVIAFKYKKRKKFRKKIGHKQKYSVVKIDKINK